MDRPITYKVAKKLKELGYKGKCDQYYGVVVDKVIKYCQDHSCRIEEAIEPQIQLLCALTYDEPLFTTQIGNFINKKYRSGNQVLICTAPTLSQVLKWIKKKFNILIMHELHPICHNVIYYRIVIWKLNKNGEWYSTSLRGRRSMNVAYNHAINLILDEKLAFCKGSKPSFCK